MKNKFKDSEKQRKSRLGEVVFDKTIEDIIKRLKSEHPGIDLRIVENLVDEDGKEIMGRAIKGIVEVNRNKIALDTVPHEYAHVYINMLEDYPVIKNALKNIQKHKKLSKEDAKEYLAIRMGEGYVEEVDSSSKIKKLILKIWTKIVELFRNKEYAERKLKEDRDYLAEAKREKEEMAAGFDETNHPSPMS